jgi:hypothetical protein
MVTNKATSPRRAIRIGIELIRRGMEASFYTGDRGKAQDTREGSTLQASCYKTQAERHKAQDT